MSIKVTSWVWEHCEEKGNHLLMMLALADACNDEGWCWPGVETLMRKVRLTTKRGARKLLSDLEQRGEIVRVLFAGASTGTGNTNRYYLKKYQEAAAEGVNSGSSLKKQEGNSSSSHKVQGGNSETPQGGNSHSSKPLLEPSIKKHISAGASTAGTGGNKKQSEVPTLNAAEFEEMVQTVKNVLNANGVRCMTLVHLLRGTSRRLKQYNMAEPVSADELRRFGNWWAHQFPTASPPLSPEKLQHHLLAFREAEAKKREADEARLAREVAKAEKYAPVEKTDEQLKAEAEEVRRMYAETFGKGAA